MRLKKVSLAISLLILASSCSSSQDYLTKSDISFLSWLIENNLSPGQNLNLFCFSSAFLNENDILDEKNRHRLQVPDLDYVYLKKQLRSLPNELNIPLDSIVKNQKELDFIFDQNKGFVEFKKEMFQTKRSFELIDKNAISDANWFLKNRDFYRLSKPMTSKNGKFILIFVSKSNGYEAPLSLNIYEKMEPGKYKSVGFYFYSF